MKKIFGSLALVALIVAFGSVAKADSFTFTVQNGGITPTALTYGTIDLTPDSISLGCTVVNCVKITVTAASGYGFFGNSGNMFGFNDPPPPESSTDFNLDLLNCSSATGCGSNLAPGSTPFDGFGKFEFAVGGGPGMSGAVTSFSFDVRRSGGSSISPGDLEEASSTGLPFFSAHAGSFATGCTGWVGGGGTGLTGGTTPPEPGCGTTVPEPGSLTLLGAGLIGLMGLIKRSKG